jgi:hypothetical protein
MHINYGLAGIFTRSCRARDEHEIARYPYWSTDPTVASGVLGILHRSILLKLEDGTQEA